MFWDRPALKSLSFRICVCFAFLVSWYPPFSGGFSREIKRKQPLRGVQPNLWIDPCVLLEPSGHLRAMGPLARHFVQLPAQLGMSWECRCSGYLLVAVLLFKGEPTRKTKKKNTQEPSMAVTWLLVSDLRNFGGPVYSHWEVLVYGAVV